MSHGVKSPWRTRAEGGMRRGGGDEIPCFAFGLDPMAGTKARDKFTNMKKKNLMTMKNKMLIGSALLMLAAKPVLGADNTGGESLELYPANQLSVDAFGTVSEGKYTIEHISDRRVRNNARGGAGAGITYFITKYIGIGADAYSENTSGTFIDNASGNLYLRVPLGQSGLAPYVYGGGGYQFDPAKVGFVQAGGGLEFRFTPHFGVFADARYVVPDRTRFYGVGRAGLRFAF